MRADYKKVNATSTEARLPQVAVRVYALPSTALQLFVSGVKILLNTATTDWVEQAWYWI